MAVLREKVAGRTALSRLAALIRGRYLPLTGGTVTGELTVDRGLRAKPGIEVYGATPYIDFHYANSTADYTSRIIEAKSGVLQVTGQLCVNTSYSESTRTGALYLGGGLFTGIQENGDIFVRGSIYHNPSAGTAAYSISEDGGGYFMGTVSCRSVTQTSDRRMKSGIRGIGRAEADKARNVRMSRFRLKGDRERRLRYGVVAQELEDAGLGCLVSEDSRGVKSVDYTALLCLKTAMLERRVAELEKGRAAETPEGTGAKGGTGSILKAWTRRLRRHASRTSCALKRQKQ